MSKIILFYKYVNLISPKRVLKWQKKICQDFGLKGRVILAHEGINATLGGSIQNLERYKEIMNASPEFGGIDYKESEGGAESFPRLRIVVKDEIVNFQANPISTDLKNTGIHLTPAQAHELITQKPENLVILDGRNYFEARIGKFTDAITPEIGHFREFPKYIDEHADAFKDKQVLMYCTGGIRCERASAYLKSKGVAQEVYQIEGGIHRYVEQFPDGFFRGKNYVFDNRVAMQVNDDVLGQCDICKAPCDEFTNCLNASCNKHFIGCDVCITKLQNTCSPTCMELVATSAVKKRPAIQRSACQL
jgi:predicted sulfurtransferase